MSVNYFADTNLLVYAFDRSEPEKQRIAQTFIAEKGGSGNLIVSTQVLQEFFVTVTRKIPKPLEMNQAYGVIESFSDFPVITVTPPLILRAIHRHRDEAFSFWDSLIVEAALESKADILLSEDMQDGRKIDSLTIQNPF